MSPPTSSTGAPSECDIEVISSLGVDSAGEPVRLGIPLPRGWCRETATIGLAGSAGDVPCQTSALDRWSDGSIRWLLLDFLASCRARSTATYRLERRMTESPRTTGDLTLAEEGRVTVDTGEARFVISTSGAFPFAHIETEGVAPINAGRSRFDVTYADGRRAPIRVREIGIEERGPVRACVAIDASCGEGAEQLDLRVRLTFWRSKAVVKIDLTLRNPHAARHRDGYWELGDAGSIYLKDVSLTLDLATRERAPVVSCSLMPGSDQPVNLPLELYQDSSGGERWHSRNHVDRLGRVTPTFRGYRLKAGTDEHTGLRADPIVRAAWLDGEIAVAVPQFWQNFPRSIELTVDALKVGCFPGQSSGFELQGGEQKTHVMMVAVGRDATSRFPLEWCRNPLLARASPEWYAAADAVPFLVPESADPNTDYLTLIHAAIDGPDAFVRKRELVDEYGWRHFGDLYADHEAVGHTGPEPLISHYNNQYDAIAGFAVHFMRSGDPRWWELLVDLATHVVDIDIYHTHDDKSAYNGGLFWHTYHYVDAGKSTHRSYPRVPGVPGGGPSNEHDYSTGLTLAYFLTGERRYRDAVIGMARWVLDMDDGSQTVFRWLDAGATGLASQTASPDYHGPGRGVGYSVDTLINGYRLTADPAYLEYAERLIKRAVHPRNDLAALNLLDAERRWHYNVFLQSLGRYLEYKREKGTRDATDDYARETLLHYARWMAKHEYPYLDKPEILDYPTETWAAQDLRKSEVFMHATRYAAGADRRTFLERAEFFYQNSISALMKMDSRSLTRPVVLLLSNGYMRAWFLQHQDDRADSPEMSAYDFGAPERFVPQKARATRRALTLVCVGSVLIVLSVLAIMLR